jgi:hypothetical protein
MTIKITKARIAVLCAIIFGFGTILVCSMLLYHSSRQSNYPILLTPTAVATIDTSLDDQVSASSLIVDATVVNVLPDEVREYIPQKGSAEAKIYQKRGISETQYSIRPVKLKVNDTLKGEGADQTITIYLTPAELDCSPNFKAGDRMVFMLTQYIGGGYTATTLQDGYYYVSADNK